jgi:predicted  nucleic acid-binding Zn-ribbon protein
MKTRVTLQQEEYKTIGTIIDKYREIEDSLTRVHKQLESLQEENEALLAKLDDVRKEEEVFFGEVAEKHGPGTLDLLTMEYVKS